MAQYEIPDNFEELQTWVDQEEKKVNEIIAEGLSINDELADLKSEEQELMAAVNAIVRKRRELEEQKHEMKKRVVASRNAQEVAKHKLQTFASEKAIRDQLEQKISLFNENTANASWRRDAFAHQIEGAARLATAERAILGDKRGLGKTFTSIIWMDMMKSKKILVFAPKDVLANFGRELENRASHRKFHVLGGMMKAQRDIFLDMCATGVLSEFVLLINYEAWRRDPGLLNKLTRIKFDTVIIDEAHNIKTKETEAFKGIKKIVHANNVCSLCGGEPEQKQNSVTKAYYTRCSVCFHEPEKLGDFWSVKNLLPMTGTAILNKPQDLWTLLHLISPEDFPDEGRFLRQYCEFYGGRWNFRYGGAERLTKSLGSRYVARDDKTAGVKFPPQEITHHYIKWDEEAKALYSKQARVIRQIREYGAIKMSDDVSLNVMGVLAELTRYRQAVVWPAGIKVRDPETGVVLYEADAHESIKMDKAQEIIVQAVKDEEDRVVMFSQFKEALKEAERRLTEAGINVARYDGDTREDVRQQIQMDFDVKTAPEKKCDNHPPGITCVDRPDMCNGYKWDVVLCHYKTGGVGLNLNAARQMVILDREWNPGKEDQAQGRIQRLDSKHETIVHVIHVEGTVDAWLDDLIDVKRGMIEGFENNSVRMQDKLNEALKDLLNGKFD